jgi:hypothetical protein
MKKSTKQTLGAGFLLTSVILAVVAYKRSKQPGLSTGVTRVFGKLTVKDLRRKRISQQLAAMRGDTAKEIDYSNAERVLPNGMTQSFARSYRSALLGRQKTRKYRYFSSKTMGLPADKVVV